MDVSPLSNDIDTLFVGEEAVSTILADESDYASRATWFRVLDRVIVSVLILTFFSNFAVIVADVFTRTFFRFSLSWETDFTTSALTVMAFLGGARAYATGDQVAIKTFVDRSPKKIRQSVRALADWFTIVAAVGIGLTALQAAWSDSGQLSPYLHIPLSSYSYTLAAAMVLVLVFAIARLTRFNVRALVQSGSVVFVLTFITVLLFFVVHVTLTAGVVLAVMLASLIVMIIVGVPVAFTFTLSAALYLVVGHAAPVSAVELNLEQGISSFVLVAVPLFILAGLMLAAGLSHRVAAMGREAVGTLRGGLLQGTVVSMFLFSGMTGVKIADIAAVGSAVAPVLKEEGYDPADSAAVMSAGAALGETIPPSTVLLVVASITALTPESLFVGGIIPAAVAAFMLMIAVYFRVKIRGPKRTFKGSIRALVQGFPALLLPVGLFLALATGIATPTEVSALAVLYALILTVVVYRTVNFRGLMNIVGSAATLTGMVLFLVAGATAFTWTLVLANVPTAVASFMTGLGSKWWLILLTVLIMPVFGSVLEGLPAILIFAPILVPVAGTLGMSPLQYAILLVMTLGIGAFAPPFGVGFYAACKVCGANVEQAMKRCWPYFGMLLVAALIVGLVPWFTLVLPNLFHVS